MASASLMIRECGDLIRRIRTLGLAANRVYNPN
jgi:hypothetical protein